MPENDGGKEKPTPPGKPTESVGAERGFPLIEVDHAQWGALPEETRKSHITHIHGRYHQLLDEMYDSADLCVVRHQSSSQQYIVWRRIVVVGTGLVAVANLLAAYHMKPPEPEWVPGWLWMCLTFRPLLAAILAASLAVLANWETLLNAQEKAQAYRESRELFLDAAREFDRRWDVLVRPLGCDPAACLNASELYQQLIAKDRDLRAKFKELTKAKK